MVQACKKLIVTKSSSVTGIDKFMPFLAFIQAFITFREKPKSSLNIFAHYYGLYNIPAVIVIGCQ